MWGERIIQAQKLTSICNDSPRILARWDLPWSDLCSGRIVTFTVYVRQSCQQGSGLALDVGQEPSKAEYYQAKEQSSYYVKTLN